MCGGSPQQGRLIECVGRQEGVPNRVGSLSVWGGGSPQQGRLIECVGRWEGVPNRVGSLSVWGGGRESLTG